MKDRQLLTVDVSEIHGGRGQGVVGGVVHRGIRKAEDSMEGNRSWLGVRIFPANNGDSRFPQSPPEFILRVSRS